MCGSPATATTCSATFRLVACWPKEATKRVEPPCGVGCQRRLPRMSKIESWRPLIDLFKLLVDRHGWNRLFNVYRLRILKRPRRFHNEQLTTIHKHGSIMTRRNIRLTFVATGESVLAEMLDDEAPEVCRIVWDLLPVQNKTIPGQ